MGNVLHSIDLEEICSRNESQLNGVLLTKARESRSIDVQRKGTS